MQNNSPNGGDKPRRSPAVIEEYPPAAKPAPQRVFHVFLAEQDFQSPSSYAAVHAELQAVGRHCQVYVDRDLADRKSLQATVDAAVRVFDEEVYPTARRVMGTVLDVDRDGRFSILFTPRLGQLANGTVSLGGFVRGSDFYRDLAAPFGNRCDLMYLNSDLKPGPFLHGLIAHEYTHAVIFCEHVFADHEPGLPRRDEESWLNEALAHLAEDLHACGWCNLDYRISAFLNDPGRYRLVVPDYYSTGLWRNPGNRGSAYLFLRWCVERHGIELMTRLIRSNRSGCANLEAATGRRFADLFRDWSLSLVTGAGWPREGDWIAQLRPTPPLRRGNDGMASRLWCGPRFVELPLTGGDCELTLAGTSAAYVLLHSPDGPAARVTLTAEPGTELQATLIRLPEASGRLHLAVFPSPARGEGKSGVPRLMLTAHDSAITLTAVAWERLIPVDRRVEDSSYRPGSMEATVRSWFGAPELRAGETRLSEPIEIPSTIGPCVFKVLGIDAGGQPVSAWAVTP